MKRITHLTALALCLFMATVASAQTKLGIQAGYNYNQAALGGNSIGDSKAVSGFHVGPIVNFGLTNLIGLRTGALLTTRGIKSEYASGNNKLNTQLTPYYIQVPLQLTVNFDLGSIIPFVAFGGYGAYGLGGKAKSELTLAGVTENSDGDIKFGDTSNDDISRLDYGAMATAGIRFENGLNLGVSYDLGLRDISTTDSTLPFVVNKIQNRTISVHIGYTFGGNE